MASAPARLQQQKPALSGAAPGGALWAGALGQTIGAARAPLFPPQGTPRAEAQPR